MAECICERRSKFVHYNDKLVRYSRAFDDFGYNIYVDEEGGPHLVYFHRHLERKYLNGQSSLDRRSEQEDHNHNAKASLDCWYHYYTTVEDNWILADHIIDNTLFDTIKKEYIDYEPKDALIAKVAPIA